MVNATMSKYIHSSTDIFEKLAEVDVEIAEKLLVVILLLSLPKHFEKSFSMEACRISTSFDLLTIKLLEKVGR